MRCWDVRVYVSLYGTAHGIDTDTLPTRYGSESNKKYMGRLRKDYFRVSNSNLFEIHVIFI